MAAAMVALVAAAFRLPMLSVRPMHTDEAVHGIKFGKLLEDGFYRYDTVDYHGPVLNYLTLVPAWLQSAKSIDEVGESTLRILPAAFGILLVVLILSFRSALGQTAAILAAIFASVSPAFVFYSRYYIHEMLLVYFGWLLIGRIRQYGQSRHWMWAVCAGLCLGLMHATKETFLLAAASNRWCF